MPQLLRWLLLALFLSSLFLGQHVKAHEEEGDGEDVDVSSHVDEEIDEEEGDGELRAAPGVTTAFIFPSFPDYKFHIGEVITVLVNVKNGGADVYNITSIAAYLHSPYDLSYYIQNFTAMPVGAIIEPFSEMSIEYAFLPDHRLEPLQLHFSAHVDYNSTIDEHRSTWFNGTVELIEKPQPFGVQQALTYTVGLGLVGVLGYVALNLSKSVSKPKSLERGTRGSSGAATAATKEKVAANTEEWAGPIYKPKNESTAVRGKRVAKPKSLKA